MRSDAAREVWLLMSDLVLDNQRRREVADALGMSFGRARAVRRLARQPMSMGELAAALGIDPPNATVRRRRPRGPGPRAPAAASHRPARQARRGDAQGQGAGPRADAILATPPPALSALGADDLEALRRILERVRVSAAG